VRVRARVRVRGTKNKTESRLKDGGLDKHKRNERIFRL
jgi:hypothetical protein